MEKYYDVTLLEQEQADTLELMSQLNPDNEEYGKALESVKTLNHLIVEQRKLIYEVENARQQRELNREIEMRKLDIQDIIESEKEKDNYVIESERLEIEREANAKKLEQDRKSMWLGFVGTIISAGIAGIGTYLGIKTVGNVYDKALAKEEDGVINTRALNTGDSFMKTVNSFFKK
jgi:hypothetical protein